MKIKTLTCLLLIIAFFSKSLEAKNTIHLITVADTKDITINESIENNLIRINRHIKRIGEKTEMTVTKYIFKGDSANTEILWHSLEKLQFDSTDVVLFHYSGHGSNYYGEYPTLHLKGDFTLSLEQIHTVLCSKSARLVLTLADCCNFNNNRNDVFWRFEDEADIASINQSKNLNYLFKESRGQVLACSSKKGTVSYYSNNLGGYFTLSFFETIRTESATDVSLTWETVLQTTKQLTNQVAKGYKVTQIPAYNITMDKRNLFNQEISNEALTEKRISIKIKNGNTLFGISEKYKVTVESLMKWNNISSSRIYAGQTIFIYLSN